MRAEPNAVLLVVTDPPDPLADIARETCPGVVVLSTGTYLDSQRFRVHLGILSLTRADITQLELPQCSGLLPACYALDGPAAPSIGFRTFQVCPKDFAGHPVAG